MFTFSNNKSQQFFLLFYENSSTTKLTFKPRNTYYLKINSLEPFFGWQTNSSFSSRTCHLVRFLCCLTFKRADIFAFCHSLKGNLSPFSRRCFVNSVDRFSSHYCGAFSGLSGTLMRYLMLMYDRKHGDGCHGENISVNGTRIATSLMHTIIDICNLLTIFIFYITARSKQILLMVQAVNYVTRILGLCYIL